MKKLMFLAPVLAICGLVSCSKENVRVNAPIPEQKDYVELQITVPGLVTKATSTTGESTVGSLQVFVFSSDGQIEGYASSSSNSATVKCLPGSKSISAVVNAPSLASVSTQSELERTVSQLSDNAIGDFVMYGNSNKSISSSASISITVSRLVARISIEKITNSLELQQYRNQTLVIKKIYLINAAGDAIYGTAAYSPTVWYNKRSNQNEQSSLLASSDLNRSVAYNSSYTTPHYFYCYANPTTTDTSASTWSPRYTRLVIEVTLGGTTYYYPVSIPDIDANHKYEIQELLITRPGSDDPDVPVTTEEAGFSVTVAPWEDGMDTTVTI